MAELMNLLKDHYGILCVGNISERKNQKMLVDAFAVLSGEIRQKVVLIFIGGNAEGLQKYTEDIALEGVHFTGTIPKGEVFQYLSKAKLLVMASRDEGFGLPIVEAYYYGVPVVMPQSIDAFPDVYSKDACIPVAEYTPEAFAEAIERAYHTAWDAEKIAAQAEKFSMEACSKQYLQVLKAAAESKKPALTVEQLQGAIIDCK